MSLHIHGSKLVVDSLIDGNVVGIKRPKAIRFDSKILSPGAYIDNRKLPSHPREWDQVLTELGAVAKKLRHDYTVVASVATGGIVHAGVLAWKLKVPHVIAKKEEKGHGLGGFIDGDPAVLAGANVLLIEDMSSTFGSCLKAMGPLEEAGALVTHTLLISTWNLPDFRQNIRGHEVHALCTGETILNQMVERGLVDGEHEDVVRHWLEYPEDESWAHDGNWLPPKGETF